jgi:hypothetical protein
VLDASFMDRREIRIGSPCTLDWRAMTPRDGGRFCGDCKKVVRDLSSMTEREAKALLRGPDNASLCVRYVYDAQGRILFGGGTNRSFDVVPSSLLSKARRAAVTIAAAALPLAAQACDAGSILDHESATHETIGEPETNQPVGQDMGGAPLLPEDVPEAPPSADAGTNDAAVDAGDDAAPPDGGVVIY